MHPTQLTTIPRRPLTAGEAISLMATNLQRLAQAQNTATAARLNIAPAPPRQSGQSSQPRTSAACLLAVSPMADNPWHVGIVFGLFTLGSVISIILWARKVAPKYREFTEPEDDAVITAAPGAMLPSCAHLVPLHHHCPYCATGKHQHLNPRAKTALEQSHNLIQAAARA